LSLNPLGGAHARQSIYDGLRRGWKAAWLASQPWEELLPLPLSEVRRRLALDAPPVYKELRSVDLKAAEAA
jgi:ubiquinone biosynthesis protein COQ4